MADENVDSSNTNGQRPSVQPNVFAKKKKRSRSLPGGFKRRCAAVGLQQQQGPAIQIHARHHQQYRPKKDPRTGRTRAKSVSQYDHSEDGLVDDYAVAASGNNWGHRPLPAPRVTEDQRWSARRALLFEQRLRHTHGPRTSIVQRCQAWVGQHSTCWTPCSHCQLCEQRTVFITDAATFAAAVPYFSCKCASSLTTWHDMRGSHGCSVPACK
jgi:hypothetical protein